MIIKFDTREYLKQNFPKRPMTTREVWEYAWPLRILLDDEQIKKAVEELLYGGEWGRKNSLWQWR